jgi:DNA repair protein RadC
MTRPTPGQLTLPLECRPRERLVDKGADGLSDIELVAVVAGRGTHHFEALAVGHRVLAKLGSLSAVSEASPHELCAIRGVGPAAAAALLAAVELGRRAGRPMPLRRTIATAADVAEVCADEMASFDREHFRAIVLDTRNRLIGMEDISVGSLTTALVHPRELFKAAIRRSAAGVVVVHNHPSGDVTPSLADIELTRRLARAGDVLGIDLLDHVIVGQGRWTSLKELNYI